MLYVKLALKNIFGAGLRTWLNVFVLSFAFVIIVFYKGILDGWNIQAKVDTSDWEVGSGQLWHQKYDPYDPFCLQEAHAPLPEKVKRMVSNDQLTPVLITQATIYPHGRMQNILLKGIETDQKIIKLPSYLLRSEGTDIPAIIGKRFALATNLKKNDLVLIRWRDKNGTFDAQEVKIVDIYNANVPTIDNGQVWIPLNDLQKMTGLNDEATLLIAGKTFESETIDNWQFKDLKFLLRGIDEVIQTKEGSARVIYALLLTIALLAIFDTQVLSIFRRQKEIGTYIALGMTRSQVIRIFTAEGSAQSFLAIGLGALYGIPFLLLMQKTGIPMPKSTDSMGMAIADKLIPIYSIWMIISTVLLVIISATIVSYFPTRSISRMKPTDALKGKLR